MKDLILAKWSEILNILENEHGISHMMIHGLNHLTSIQWRTTKYISLWMKSMVREV